MTRRFILTTATLAAFLATGTPLAAAPSADRRSESATTRERTLPGLPPLLAIGDELMAVHAVGSAAPGSTLGVALFVAPNMAPGSLSLWAGLKNGWGSQISNAEAVDGSSGLLVASVDIPALLPAQARLWIGLERGGHRDTASVALPA